MVLRPSVAYTCRESGTCRVRIAGPVRRPWLKEVHMDNLVDVAIPLDPEAAKVLENQARREAIGRYLSSLLTGNRMSHVLAEAIADAKMEARANGLTDEDIDAELDAWRAERGG
jgi:hypothetical protein